MKKAIILLVFSVAFLTSWANDPLLDSAKSSYDQGDFNTAINHYEAVLKKGLKSADLNYNLGNAYFRNGQLGLSILYFEKALKIEASNENAQFNLKLANTKLSDKFDAVPQFSVNRILIGINTYLSHEILSILAILFVLIAAGIFIWGKKEKTHKLIKYSRILALAGILITLLAWKMQTANNSYKAGILIQPASNIFSEPNPNSTLLFEIHEGTKVEIISESDGWLNIKAPNNEVGWIELINLGEI